MMLVKTYVDRSLNPSAGAGLFAAEKISKGTKVWEYTDGMDITYVSIQTEDKDIEKFLTTYCFRNKGTYILCVDNARFINHSTAPNLDDISFSYTIAARDIEVGEELTSNYEHFGPTLEDKLFNKL